MKAVLLDFYGTLAHATSVRTEWETVRGSRGIELPMALRIRWSEGALDGQEHVEHSASRAAYEAWMRARLVRMLMDCGIGPDQGEPLAHELREASKSFVLDAYPEVADSLARIRGTGVAIVVCSNWDWDIDRAVEQAGLAGLVDGAISSARVGARKPHPRIYRHALLAAGVDDPTDALFVGDSVAADVEGPMATGIRAIHLWRGSDSCAEPPALPPGAARIRDLAAVVDLV